MSATSQPNILFILADDMGWGDVSFHDSLIRTPNLDRLAREGVELTQHYVCPMCTPTRASLLTGRHPGRFGRHATTPSNAPVLPDGYETLATTLRSAGYDTGLFGKWHLGSESRFCPNEFGFNTSYGSLAGGIDPYNHRYKEGDFSVTWHRNGELIEERGHVTDLIAREACEWIESRSTPWFCYVPFTAVHVPIKAPQPWLDRYEFETYDPDPKKDRSFKRYAAYASHMDHAVGKLVESLALTCQLENTIVIFSSDNGAIEGCPLHGSDKYPGWQEANPRLGSNGPFRGQKAQLYEGGIRTPTLINWLGHLDPGKNDHAMHIADWSPTLTSLAGTQPENDPLWDGVDMWPVITGKQEQNGHNIFWNFKGTEFGLREGDWKLIAKAELKPEDTQLFNISSDPYETRDEADCQRERVKHMLDVIRQEREKDDVSKRPEVTSGMVS